MQRTILEALSNWVQVQPDKTLFTYLNDDGSVAGSATYKSVDQKSLALAAHLISSGISKGDRVLLVFEPSLNYIISFLGCLRAGIIAVPVFPPDPFRLKKDIVMFATITGNCGARVALTSSAYNSAKKMSALKNMFSRDLAWPELQVSCLFAIATHRFVSKAK